MLKKIGIIGVGHLAEYLLKGLVNTDRNFEFFLADPVPERAEKLARYCRARVFTDNQAAVDQSEIVILSVRPDQFNTALDNLKFTQEQILAAATVGIPLSVLQNSVRPARAVRVLPISCVAINQSPILIYPENPEVRKLFSLLGRVHLLEKEPLFEPATALVGAYYAWLFVLMAQLTEWTAEQGLSKELARALVVETMQGASGMAEAQKDLSLQQIWESLATPGGISQHGIDIIRSKDGLVLWSQALDSVTRMLKK